MIWSGASGRVPAGAPAQQRAAGDVPIRFEGLPAEDLQVDGGESRRFPFTQQVPSTRYFLACRLKDSRFRWVCFTTDMRQETLFRGLVDCFLVLGWVPWVLVFDHMKPVTSGRESGGQPIWTPALVQLAGEFGVHPQACDPGAGNQQGSVESLVKWVKGNFLLGRTFAADADLAAQTTAWGDQVNARPSDATGELPAVRLAAEAGRGGQLPLISRDVGLLPSGVVSREALVAVAGSRGVPLGPVPVAHVGAPVTVRLHRDRVRICGGPMTPPDALLSTLQLHQAAAALPVWLDRAAQQELSSVDFLGGLLADEVAARTTAETPRRLCQAGFPFAATIEQVNVRCRPELKR